MPRATGCVRDWSSSPCLRQIVWSSSDVSIEIQGWLNTHNAITTCRLTFDKQTDHGSVVVCSREVKRRETVNLLHCFVSIFEWPSMPTNRQRPKCPGSGCHLISTSFRNAVKCIAEKPACVSWWLSNCCGNENDVTTSYSFPFPTCFVMIECLNCPRNNLCVHFRPQKWCAWSGPCDRCSCVPTIIPAGRDQRARITQ